METLAALLSFLCFGACQGDETVAAYGGSAREWTLIEIDGVAFDARATLSFPEPGKIEGQAPCNRYSGEMTAPYPWFEAEAIAVTRRACGELAQETRFFTTLTEMAFSEVAGSTMILSNETGREMVFEAGQ